MAIGAILGGIASAGVSLAPSIIGGLVDMRNTDKTNQANKDIASENVAFQRQNLEYQQALQQQIFEREDTAYQRTVNDMRAAGLSPLSMQNTNGAGEAIQTDALHSDYQAQKSDVGQILASAPQVASILSDLARSDAETDLLNAQKNKVDAETADVLFKSETDKDFYRGEKVDAKNMRNLLYNNQLTSNDINYYNLEHLKRDNDFDKAFGSMLRMENLKSAMLGNSNAMEDYTEKYRFNTWARRNNIFSAMTPDERKAMLVANALGLNNDDDANGIGKTIAGVFGLNFLESLFKSSGIRLGR